MENQNQLAIAEQQTSLVFDSIAHFEDAQRMCKCLSTAGILPDHFRGENNIGNCMIALEIAWRGKKPIMEVFQNLIIVKGKVSWYATYLIGCVNSCGKYTKLKWQSEGDNTANWRMRAYTTEIATGEELVGTWVSLQMAKQEGWGGKWQSMPEQMLRYRSAAFWVRAFDPNITGGIKDQYEVEDIEGEIISSTPASAEKRTAAFNALAEAVKGKGKKKPAVEPEDVNPEPANDPTPAPEQKPAPAPAAAESPEKPAEQSEKPAEQPAQGGQPLIAIKVEQPAAEEKKPLSGKDNPYFQKAWANMNGGNQPATDANGAQLPFDNPQQ